MQKKIQYLRIILTSRCNLSCYYCHKEGSCDHENKELTTDEMIKLMRCFIKIGFKKLKFMGGEPTLRRDLPNILEGISKFESNIDTSIITNGLFEKEFIDSCFDKGLKRINVSLHVWNNRELLGKMGMSNAALDKCINNIQYLHELKRLSKLNYVVLKNSGFTELIDLISWVNDNQMLLDVLNVLYSEEDLELGKGYCSFEEIQGVIKERFNVIDEVLYQNPYSLPSLHLRLDKGGVINLKTTPLNSVKPFNCCKSCMEYEFCKEGIKAIRLTEDGFIKPCLFRDDNLLNLRQILNNEEDEIAKIIAEYLEIL